MGVPKIDDLPSPWLVIFLSITGFCIGAIVVYRSLYPVKVTDEERARQSSLMPVSLKTQNEIRRIQEGKH